MLLLVNHRDITLLRHRFGRFIHRAILKIIVNLLFNHLLFVNRLLLLGLSLLRDDLGKSGRSFNNLRYAPCLNRYNRTFLGDWLFRLFFC